ncbi:hypothetical protein MNV49_000981 [Pseudohyphozyma bogoriensis]|nr:hypothetical protein MNV49_000981 [Pseudohyphozyma bogoriensis]
MQIVGKGTEVEDYWSAAAGSAKGKGKAVARQGDVSPATSELIRGVDAMDLTDKASLKSFLSLANEHSLSTLLELKGRGAYTDAVWGGVEVSEGVRRVLEKAREDESGGKSAGEEEAKARAVRRLGMVMRHLNASGGGAEATFATPTYQDNTGNEFQHFARTTPSTQSPFQSTPTLLDASSHKLLASPNSFSSTSPLTSTSGDPRVVDSPASLSSLDNIVTSESTSTLDSQTPLFGAGMISRGGASRLQSHQQQHPYSFYGADTDSLPRARGEVYGRTDSENLVMPPSASSTSSTRGATSHVFALAPGAEESVREGSNEDGEEEEERDGTLTPFAEFMQDKLLAMGGTSGGGLCYRG